MFAEHVVTEILEPVPHCHVALTIPRVFRGLFQRERSFLGLLARVALDEIVPGIRAILDRRGVAPGLIVSIRTIGSYAASFHPHVPALVYDIATVPAPGTGFSYLIQGRSAICGLGSLDFRGDETLRPGVCQ